MLTRLLTGASAALAAWLVWRMAVWAAQGAERE